MKFLYDGPAKRLEELQPKHPVILGQLLTPLTSFRYLDCPFGVDNGAFSRFDAKRFSTLLKRQLAERSKCLFVAAPDVIGSARRTLEVFDTWGPRLEGWPVALVLQDGQEDLPVPWPLVAAVFVGGTTEWKMSKAAADLVKTALMVGKHVHVGRVNTPARFKYFADLGANTCDGSGVSRYNWMLERISACQFEDYPLFPEGDSIDAEERGTVQQVPCPDA